MREHDFGRRGSFGRGGPSPERLRGRRGRVFDSAELQLVVLDLITDQPRHGYELIREIEALSGGLYAPSPGMIYPTLSLLLEMGLVEEVSTDGARKSFAITEAGKAHLAENEKPLAAARSRLAALAEAKDRADPAPLRRAMGNLREVLIIASRKPGFDEKKILESARLIDELAGTIERL
ncbi:PadR family transcriptional regulator [Pelagibacterium flavum]|uniref:PadR family transcriptional regulator n=1 Tax=Pelagibacterium flavum TaxID=2984530 RepID=A0ABY6IRD7_9HYPH|nr:PadR family transcriptional regulator [Pelagibacterium sp. YIM 151497]UYQ73173.1 PadR family transcriptional regulator [Pelagibacterium sp. YIM 151497]|tara:strand:- start:6135 stop:6671 length:537 start_codon:yes stop_codon:yes gene_type:complete